MQETQKYRKGETFIIKRDSKSGLDALNKHTFTTKTVKECMVEIEKAKEN
jgi:hypothetical protein